MNVTFQYAINSINVFLLKVYINLGIFCTVVSRIVDKNTIRNFVKECKTEVVSSLPCGGSCSRAGRWYSTTGVALTSSCAIE